MLSAELFQYVVENITHARRLIFSERLQELGPDGPPQVRRRAGWGAGARAGAQAGGRGCAALPGPTSRLADHQQGLPLRAKLTLAATPPGHRAPARPAGAPAVRPAGAAGRRPAAGGRCWCRWQLLVLAASGRRGAVGAAGAGAAECLLCSSSAHACLPRAQRSGTRRRVSHPQPHTPIAAPTLLLVPIPPRAAAAGGQGRGGRPEGGSRQGDQAAPCGDQPSGEPHRPEGNRPRPQDRGTGKEGRGAEKARC